MRLDFFTEITRVRDQLRGLAPLPVQQFNMNLKYVNSECGTAGCIAGCIILNNNLPAYEIGISEVEDAFEPDFRSLADNLFFGWTADKPLTEITPEEAAQAIDNILAGCSRDKIWSHIEEQCNAE